MKGRHKDMVLTFALLSGVGAMEAQADMPVIDFAAAANAAQELEAWGQQAQQMQQQIGTMMQQLQQVQMLYTSVTGGPESLKNLSMLGTNPSLYRYLPNDYQEVLQSGYTGWQSIHEANQITDMAKSGMSGQGLQTLTQRAMQVSSNVGMMMAAYNAAAQRLGTLQALLNQVDSTPDAKSIQDLQGRIQAEQTLLQNEQARIQLLGQLAALQRDQEAQKAQQAAIAATGGKIPTSW